MLLLLTVLLSATAALAAPRDTPGVALCYYGSWATYRAWPGTLKVDTIDASLCSHAIYAFAGLDATDLSVISLDPWNDLEDNWGLGSYKKFAALPTKFPGLKTLLAIGGWNEGSGKYSSMAATAAGRRRFAAAAAEYAAQFGFGGIDLDWEYPARRDGRPEDKANLVLLLKEMRAELDARGLELAVAVGADPSMLVDAYDAAGIGEYAHYINLMEFDLYTASSSNVTLPHAALSSSNLVSVEASVEAWVAAGAPRAKLVMGVPLYARTYTLQNAAVHGVRAPASGPGKAGPVTQEAGYLTYYELCMAQEDEGWTVEHDGDDVYSVGGDQWASYDDVQVVEKKGQWAVEQGLAGAFVWALEGDDNLDACGTGKGPLLKALARGLGRA